MSILRKSLLLVLFPWVAGAFVSGCGYTLQNSKNPLVSEEGVQTIYVRPVGNATYKPGVENLVFNALIRTVAAHRKVTLVSHPEDADATLESMVTNASYGVSASTLLGVLNSGKFNGYYNDQTVASEYVAALNCSFRLVRRVPRPEKPGEKPEIWSASFSRSKPFSAAAQLGVLGTTTALINDSEFDRALVEMAQNMMGDLHESMLARF